ncbi:calponin-1-like [Mizuhopecten yessoensis]|uniref:Transgelin n=1 Tax=Mizuhopecten yessoensis TaxID=6573 RepID=A0A210QEE6_MIZYE|nr:calponin-1-like [Mizuhopecten yessoensis]XP_021360186.1 calponin-1-like [Mizuhopecten yessoensis]XP_021360187.1 calponin-1-like [Mizuhopecten yessoensis]OWF47093.1 Myophilin [Mizuhopecten yessoensis]
MSKRMRGYGLSAEIDRKRRDQYNNEIDREQEARLWIEEVIGEELVQGSDRSQPLTWDGLHKSLMDGIVLCKLINTLSPGSVKKINKPMTNYHKMENIANFLSAIYGYGVAKEDQFNTPDLFENVNMLAVVNTLHGLGRAAQKNGFTGSVLGPKEADYNPRNFNEEVMNKGQTVIGLQAGSNKGASQSGMSFGRTRNINEPYVSS